MGHTIKANWQGKMHFISDSAEGQVKLDAAEAVGGENNGLRSKPLMLTSLAGCTGMDVASLMKKMRVTADDFSIEVQGELTDEHPKIYKTTHIIYTFTGENLDQEKLTKAVNLSMDRYCGVIAMFRSFSKVSSEIVFNQP